MLPESSIGERLATLASERPDTTVLRCGEQHRTAAQLESNSNRLAHWFEALGVVEGDFVTLALPNGIRFIESVFAVWKLGAVPQPVSFRLPGRELEAIIELADPKLVLGVDSERVPHCQVIPDDYEIPDDVPDSPVPFRWAKYNRAITSGGSTGRPKLIVDRRRAAAYHDTVLPWYEATVVPGPLYHTAPFMMSTRSILQGNLTVIFERFDPEATLAAVAESRASFLYSVPTMLSRMWKLPEEVRDSYDLSSLRVLLHAAAPCPDWLKRAWIGVLGDRLVEMYSSSEGAARFIIKGNEWLAHPGSVGRPRVGDEVKILDDEGNQVPTGTVGNVYMRSSGDRDFEYLGAEQLERLEGFVTVGDLGHLDADGYLYLADRRADLILRGGANIYPAEVEAAIEEHPLVRSVAVVGVKDEDLGQRVHAVVDSPLGVSESELRTFVAERLVQYKCPESYEFVDIPVRDEAGKVRRSSLVR